MAYAFVNQTSQGNASGGALTVTKPTSTADGHLIIIADYLEADTNTWTSVGSGFAVAATFTNTGRFLARLLWKWAASEPASWTWTPNSSNWRTVCAASYSGGSGSGTATDVQATNQGDAQLEGAQTAGTVTTTATNDILIFGYANFGGTNPSSITGAATNLRVSLGGISISDANFASIGATGSSQAVGCGTQDFGAAHQAFLLSPGGSGWGVLLGLQNNRLVVIG